MSHHDKNQEVYIYELNEIHPSPERVAVFLETSVDDVLKALAHPRNHGVCRGMHICWNDARNIKAYKPVRVIEKDLIFPSVTHMAFYYGFKDQEIYDALKQPDGFWYGWHLEHVDTVPEPTYVE